jgi:hypothetical protein
MEAKIVRFKVYEGMMDFIHGGGEMVQRLFLSESSESGILFGTNNGNPVVSRCPKAPGSVIGTVEVPVELLPVLQEYLRVQMTLNSALEPYFKPD